MKKIIVLLMVVVFYNCTSNHFHAAKKIYSSNKGKDFSEFENWNIYLREGKNDVYLLDYMQNDNVESRYLIIDKDSFLYKSIFPDVDSVFQILKADTLVLKNKSVLTFGLYEKFKSLGVDALHFRQVDSLFLLKKGDITLLYSKEKECNILRQEKYIGYKQIDTNWYYYDPNNK